MLTALQEIQLVAFKDERGRSLQRKEREDDWATMLKEGGGGWHKGRLPPSEKRKYIIT